MTPIIYLFGSQELTLAGPTSGGGDQSPPTVLFTEGFEDTNLAGRGWYDDTTMVRNTANHIPGSLSSCRYRFLSGATTPTAGVTQRKLFTATDRVYLSYWILYSANWVGSGTADHPHQFHFMSDMDDIFDGLSENWLITYTEEHYTSGNLHPRLSMQDSRSVNSSLGTPPNNLVGVTENRSVGRCNCNGNLETGYTGDCFDNGGYMYSDKILDGPNTASDATKVNWNFIETYMQMNSVVGGVSQFDGVLQYWWNGTLVVDRHDLQYRTAQHPNLKFNQFIIAPYIGNGSPLDQSFFVDDITVATGRVGAGDTTAPILSAQTVGSLTSVGGTPQVTTNEGNGTAYMVVVGSGNTPSVTQIKAGQDSSGSAALASQNQPVTSTGVQTFSAVTGLSSATSYDCWFVHTDAANNNSTSVKASFTTSGVDTTAPVLSAQTVSSVSSSGGTPQVTTNEGNGTAYMVVVANNDTPSVAQIKAGQNSSGGAALANQSKSVTATGVQTFSAVSGLTDTTPYDCWFVHTDAAGNNSTAVKADFTTLAPGSWNEPTGMTLISNRPFSAVNEGAWDDSWGANGTIITDATAPESPSNVLRMHLPAGFGEGGGPCSGDLTFPTNYRTVYVRYSCKFDATWQGPSSGIDKAFYIYDDAGHPTIIFDMDGDGFVDKLPMVAGQDIVHAGTPSPGGDLQNPFWPPNVNGTLIPRGQWFTVEFIAVANTAGTQNGSLDWWVNGVKKGSVTNIQFTTGARLWNLLHYTEIYTGTSQTRPTSAQNVYWDNLYISGK